jgi:hypothetical protein
MSFTGSPPPASSVDSRLAPDGSHLERNPHERIVAEPPNWPSGGLCAGSRAAFIPRLASLERFMVEIRRRLLPRHGTDHDSQTLPSFPRFCLLA